MGQTTKSLGARLLDARRFTFEEVAFAIEEDRFLELEYVALRKEIDDILARRFRILWTGTVGPLAAVFSATALEGEPNTIPGAPDGGSGFYFFVPMIVAVLVRLYVVECNALMRCGRYIREVIEPKVAGKIGWETWLEELAASPVNVRRRSDKLMNNAFLWLSVLYFFAGASLFYAKDLDFISNLFEQFPPLASLIAFIAALAPGATMRSAVIVATATIFGWVAFRMISIMMNDASSSTSVGSDRKKRRGKTKAKA